MFGFILKLIIAVGCFIAASYIKSVNAKGEARRSGDSPMPGFLVGLARTLGIFIFLWAIVGTSLVWVKSGHIATLKRVYFATSLKPGQIVALEGQLGPQARVLTAGFHVDPLITLLNDVDQEPVFTVPDGSCALLSAKDGLPITGGQAFAPPWSDGDKQKMVNDALYYLVDGKGQRGPQATVLTPGSYTINPFLWEKPRIIKATRVEQGTVGVVKSSVHAAVDFGAFKRPSPTNTSLQVISSDKLPKNSANALLVPVGAIGVWEEPLPNGMYYINTDAYRVTMVPTVAQVYEYKGGYKRRTVDISVDATGQINERVSEVEVTEIPTSADKAIFCKPEGWDVPQELRVLAQVSPNWAPFVVASLGLTEANASQIIEDRVVTPIIRSITRDVIGGSQILFKIQRAETDTNGIALVDEKTGEPKVKTVHEFRQVKVLDLLENRSSIEEAIESQVKPEALKEGVTVNEVRLSESAIPAELLIARKREQLAQQLKTAWQQEEIAQGQRQKTENARAQANQQDKLVQAEIAEKAALRNKNARSTDGEAEKAYMMAVADGQKAQKDVLGPEETVKLQKIQMILKAIEGLTEKNPNLLITAIQNSHKFVPNIVVSGSGTGGFEGASAIFGSLMSGGNALPPTIPLIPMQSVVNKEGANVPPVTSAK